MILSQTGLRVFSKKISRESFDYKVTKSRHNCRSRYGNNPSDDYVFDYSSSDCGEPLGGAGAHDGSGDDMGGADGNSENGHPGNNCGGRGLC